MSPLLRMSLLLLISLNTSFASEPCIDTDGDGWGWDGNASCLIERLDSICIDTPPVNDGWGWDGLMSCRIEIISQPPSRDCIDSDGDGWGWDGVESCLIESTNTNDTALICVDSAPFDDGWGWNGVNSCQLEETLPVFESGYLCSSYNNAVETWTWDFRQEGIFNEGGVKTGTWFRLPPGSGITVAPFNSEITIVSERADRSLSLSDSNNIEWGYCDTTANSNIPNAIETFYCLQNIPLALNQQLYMIFDDTARVSYFSEPWLQIEDADFLSITLETVLPYIGEPRDQITHYHPFTIGAENFYTHPYGDNIRIHEEPIFNRDVVCPLLLRG